jgi:hypothetical protein
MNCHKVYDSSKSSDSKALSENCHKMTEVYISENFDLPIDPPSEALIDESVLKPVENSENLEDIQFCHFMTVEAQSLVPQRVEAYDSSMTVDDSSDSSALNEDEVELLEFFLADYGKKGCTPLTKTDIVDAL